MGQHLQLYVSKDVSIADAMAWCRYRPYDIVKAPDPESEDAIEKVEAAMRAARRPDTNFEHGSKSSCDKWGVLVWEAYVVDSVLLQAVAEIDREDGVLDFLARHPGWVVWGDNDGV